MNPLLYSVQQEGRKCLTPKFDILVILCYNIIVRGTNILLKERCNGGEKLN